MFLFQNQALSPSHLQAQNFQAAATNSFGNPLISRPLTAFSKSKNTERKIIRKSVLYRKKQGQTQRNTIKRLKTAEPSQIIGMQLSPQEYFIPKERPQTRGNENTRKYDQAINLLGVKNPSNMVVSSYNFGDMIKPMPFEHKVLNSKKRVINVENMMTRLKNYVPMILIQPKQELKNDEIQNIQTEPNFQAPINNFSEKMQKRVFASPQDSKKTQGNNKIAGEKYNVASQKSARRKIISFKKDEEIIKEEDSLEISGIQMINKYDDDSIGDVKAEINQLFK